MHICKYVHRFADSVARFLFAGCAVCGIVHDLSIPSATSPATRDFELVMMRDIKAVVNRVQINAHPPSDPRSLRQL